MTPLETWLVIGPMAGLCYLGTWWAWKVAPKRPTKSNLARSVGGHNDLRQGRQ